MKWHRDLSFSGLTLGILALIMLSACNPDQQIALGGTRAWIDVPRDRSVLSLKPHEVMAHASDAGGLRQVELVVNGSSIGAMACENLAQPLVTCRVMWNPLAPGDYRLEARATNPGGAVGLSSPVYVSIGAASAPATLPPGILPPPPQIFTLTPTPTPTRAPPLAPTPTPTPTLLGQPPPSLIPPPPPIITLTPSPTPTQRTDVPASCPGAPVVSSFTASPGKITEGETTTLSWGNVSNATSVEIDHGIGGVAAPGSRAVSPDTTTTYTLIARGCGGTVTRQVVILVTVPPTRIPTRTPTRTQTAPPPQPPAAPSNLHKVSRSCSTPDQIRIGWDDNSNNETGFRIYRRLRNNSSSPWSAWALRTTVGANTEQYTDGSDFTKSQDVEYEVKAYNAAGESGGPNLFVSECVD